MAGYGDPAACAVGGRGAFRVDQGRRAEYRTHLEFLLGHKILHTPDDLDGGPVVLPQPAVENGEEGVSAHQMVIPRPPLSEARRLPKRAPHPRQRAGPFQKQGERSTPSDGDLQAHILVAGGEAEAKRL